MITIICGHYGCGKTNLAINLAIEKSLENKRVMLVDMDIVNPYFRSGDYSELLNSYNIELVTPNLLGSTSDTPSISPAINSAFIEDGKDVIIDLGGDDAGATAIGSFSERILNYEMIYVINKNRMELATAQSALSLLREIEKASGLFATAVVNNTHLGVETNYDIVKNSLEYAENFSKKANLPLLYSTIPDFVECSDFKKIKRYVKFPWED